MEIKHYVLYMIFLRPFSIFLNKSYIPLNIYLIPKFVNLKFFRYTNNLLGFDYETIRILLVV